MAVWGMDDLGPAEAGLKKQLEAVVTASRLDTTRSP